MRAGPPPPVHHQGGGKGLPRELVRSEREAHWEFCFPEGLRLAVGVPTTSGLRGANRRPGTFPIGYRSHRVRIPFGGVCNHL